MPTATLASPANAAMSYESFKPRFPIDPFQKVGRNTKVESTRPPWTFDADALPSQLFLEMERRVVLVIGQPSLAALDPLLHSSQLTSSLVILASHRPPAVPSTTRPVVRILRLRNPVAVEDAGAARLVDILEWATQVARLWRQTGGPRVQELLEEVSPGTDSVKLGQTYGRVRYSSVPTIAASTPTTPAASMNNLTTSAFLAAQPVVSRRRLSMRSFRSRTEPNIAALHPEPEQRPLDAIFHFIPADVSEKAMLKSAILVTSLSRPYLSTAPSRAPATRFWGDGPKAQKPTNGKRLSIFRFSSSAASSSTTVCTVPKAERSHASSPSPTKQFDESSRPSSMLLTRCRKPRLIHVMPSPPAKAGQMPSLAAAAQARLTRSIEAFLLSFSCPLPDTARGDADLARPRPYLVSAVSLKDIVQVCHGDNVDSDNTTEWTLLDLIMSGAMEADDPISDKSSNIPTNHDVKGKQKEAAKLLSAAGEYEWMERRAWIGGLSDVRMQSKSGAKMNGIQTFARGDTERRTRTLTMPQPLPNAVTHQKVSLTHTEKSLPPPPPPKGELEENALRLMNMPERPPRTRPPIRAGIGAGFNMKLSGLRHRPSWTDLSPPAESHEDEAHKQLAGKSQASLHRADVVTSEAHGLPTPPDSEEASIECEIGTPPSSCPCTSVSTSALAKVERPRSHERDEQQRERSRGRDSGRERASMEREEVERHRRRARTESDHESHQLLEREERPKLSGKNQPALSPSTSHPRSGSPMPTSRSQRSDTAQDGKPTVSPISLPMSNAATARTQIRRPSNSLVTTPMAEVRAAARHSPVRSKSAAVTADATESRINDVSSYGRGREAKSEVGHGRHERKTSLRREERPVRTGMDEPRTSPRKSKDHTYTHVEPASDSRIASTPSSTVTESKRDKVRTFVQVGRGGVDGMVELVAARHDHRGERSRREHDYTSRDRELVRKSSKWRLWKPTAE